MRCIIMADKKELEGEFVYERIKLGVQKVKVTKVEKEKD